MVFNPFSSNLANSAISFDQKKFDHYLNVLKRFGDINKINQIITYFNELSAKFLSAASAVKATDFSKSQSLAVLSLYKKESELYDYLILQSNEAKALADNLSSYVTSLSRLKGEYEQYLKQYQMLKNPSNDASLINKVSYYETKLQEIINQKVRLALTHIK